MQVSADLENFRFKLGDGTLQMLYEGSRWKRCAGGHCCEEPRISGNRSVASSNPFLIFALSFADEIDKLAPRQLPTRNRTEKLGRDSGLLLQGGDHVLCPVHFRKGEEKSQRGFRALILIYAVDMQSVSATARLGVVERNAQIVSALKPFESLSGLSQPVGVAGSLVSFHARANGGMCLNRLLVERGRLLAALPKTIGTNRPKVSFGCELVLNKPAQRFETDVKEIRLPGPTSRHDQGKWKAGIVVTDYVFEPKPVVMSRLVIGGAQTSSELEAKLTGHQIAAESPEIFVQTDDRERPGVAETQTPTLPATLSQTVLPPTSGIPRAVSVPRMSLKPTTLVRGYPRNRFRSPSLGYAT